MKARGGIIIGALLVLASCTSDSQSPLTPTPAAPPPREPERVLTLTLLQGENLSGPFAGTVTGPNGFTCALAQTEQTKPCPPAQFNNGQALTLQVTLTAGVPGDRPIWRTLGCDAVTTNTCSVTMMSDRSVTISIGCAVC